MRAGLRVPLLYSNGSRHFSVYVSRFAFGHGLSANPLFLSLFWFLCVKKNDVLAVGEGKHVHFLSKNHAESNAALPK